MITVAIDPGSENSAYVILEGDAILEHDIVSNPVMLSMISGNAFSFHDPQCLAVEMVASYGMAVGREVFETCVWVGRYIQATRLPWQLVYRRDTKMHILGNNSGDDKAVRAELIHRYGPGKEKAIGTKAKPGPLFGFAKDQWAALGVGLAFNAGCATGPKGTP